MLLKDFVESLASRFTKEESETLTVDKAIIQVQLFNPNNEQIVLHNLTFKNKDSKRELLIGGTR